MAKELTAAQIRASVLNVLPNAKPGASIGADAVYALPKHSYVEDLLLPAFARWSRANGLWMWHTRSDCDDKADAFRVFAQQCFRDTNDRTKAEGFAVFRIFYHIDGDSERGHAINTMLTEKGWIFVEPQTAKVVELSTLERMSVWTVY